MGSLTSVHHFIFLSLADMLTGLLVSGSVRLSEVARALHEPIPEHSTHKRLSRNLGNPEVGRIVASNLLRTAAEFIDAETLLVVDTSELLKPYAAKMQYLAPASAAGDGNRGTRKGYRVCEVVSWDLRGGPMPAFAQLADDLPDNQPELPHRVSAWNDFVFTPVAQTLWSTEVPGFVSRTDEIVGLIRNVSAACGGRGVFHVNATAHADLPAALAAEPCHYTARVAVDYPLLHRRRRADAETIGRACRKPYGTTIYKSQEDHEESVFLHFGATPVRLPTRPQRPHWLLTIESGLATQGEQPTSHLLTTRPMRQSREILWRQVLSFLQFGHAVNTNRELKHHFNFDDVRVLSYQRLRNLAVLVQAAAFVEAQWPGIALQEWIFLKPQSLTPVFRTEAYTTPVADHG